MHLFKITFITSFILTLITFLSPSSVFCEDDNIILEKELIKLPSLAVYNYDYAEGAIAVRITGSMFDHLNVTLRRLMLDIDEESDCTLPGGWSDLTKAICVKEEGGDAEVDTSWVISIDAFRLVQVRSSIDANFNNLDDGDVIYLDMAANPPGLYAIYRIIDANNLLVYDPDETITANEINIDFEAGEQRMNPTSKTKIDNLLNCLLSPDMLSGLLAPPRRCLDTSGSCEGGGGPLIDMCMGIPLIEVDLCMALYLEDIDGDGEFFTFLVPDPMIEITPLRESADPDLPPGNDSLGIGIGLTDFNIEIAMHTPEVPSEDGGSIGGFTVYLQDNEGQFNEATDLYIGDAYENLNRGTITDMALMNMGGTEYVAASVSKGRNLLYDFSNGVIYNDSFGTNERDTTAVMVGDFAGDANPDVIFINFEEDNELWVGNGTPSGFVDQTPGGACFDDNADMGYSADAMDIDGDADLDFVIARTTDAAIGVENRRCINNGDGTFTAGLFGNQTFSRAVKLIDDTGDNCADLMLVANTGEPNELYEINCSGGFTDESDNIPMDSAQTYGFLWVDANDDGLEDIVTLNATANYVFTDTGADGNGDGVNEYTYNSLYMPAQDSASHDGDYIDIDLDGDPDLIVANEGQNVFLMNMYYMMISSNGEIRDTTDPDWGDKLLEDTTAQFSTIGVVAGDILDILPPSPLAGSYEISQLDQTDPETILFLLDPGLVLAGCTDATPCTGFTYRIRDADLLNYKDMTFGWDETIDTDDDYLPEDEELTYSMVMTDVDGDGDDDIIFSTANMYVDVDLSITIPKLSADLALRILGGDLDSDDFSETPGQGIAIEIEQLDLSKGLAISLSTEITDEDDPSYILTNLLPYLNVACTLEAQTRYEDAIDYYFGPIQVFDLSETIAGLSIGHPLIDGADIKLELGLALDNDWDEGPTASPDDDTFGIFGHMGLHLFLNPEPEGLCTIEVPTDAEPIMNGNTTYRIEEGDPNTPTADNFMIGLAISQNFISELLYDLYISKLLCLSIDKDTPLIGELIGDFLTTDGFGFLMPQLSDSFEKNHPLAIRIRPTLVDPRDGTYIQDQDTPRKEIIGGSADCRLIKPHLIVDISVADNVDADKCTEEYASGGGCRTYYSGVIDEVTTTNRITDYEAGFYDYTGYIGECTTNSNGCTGSTFTDKSAEWTANEYSNKLLVVKHESDETGYDVKEPEGCSGGACTYYEYNSFTISSNTDDEVTINGGFSGDADIGEKYFIYTPDKFDNKLIKIYHNTESTNYPMGNLFTVTDNSQGYIIDVQEPLTGYAEEDDAYTIVGCDIGGASTACPDPIYRRLLGLDLSISLEMGIEKDRDVLPPFDPDPNDDDYTDATECEICITLNTNDIEIENFMWYNEVLEVSPEELEGVFSELIPNILGLALNKDLCLTIDLSLLLSKEFPLWTRYPDEPSPYFAGLPAITGPDCSGGGLGNTCLPLIGHAGPDDDGNGYGDYLGIFLGLGGYIEPRLIWDLLEGNIPGLDLSSLLSFSPRRNIPHHDGPYAAVIHAGDFKGGHLELDALESKGAGLGARSSAVYVEGEFKDYTWRLDSGPWHLYREDRVLRLPFLLEGRHTLEVKGRRADRTVGGWPAALKFVVDSMGPRVRVVGDDIVKGMETRFGVRVRDARTPEDRIEVSYALDDDLVVPVPCLRGPHRQARTGNDREITLYNLDEGHHTLTVSAIDEAGNVSTAMHNFQVEYGSKAGGGGCVSVPGSGGMESFVLILIPFLIFMGLRKLNSKH